MEVAPGTEPMIDEEVKAFVLSLCSALGGSSAGDDGRYVLGDDALAVLKDIKRWLRLYDDKLSRLDVARLLASANLVKGDLLEILASWPAAASEGSFRSKVALLCVDLLTQLTWPIDKDEQTTTMHRYLHIPFLKKAHASYKDAVLHHDSQQMLRTVVRVALPALAQARNERSPMEDTIIKVVLYFFRNMAMITQPDDVMIDEVESDISRSATIDAFHRQDIFNLILTICSGMHEDFDTHEVEVLDIVFHIVKGVDVDRLFMEKEELVSEQTKELQGLLSKEKGMLAGYARHAPSRHNRFGGMMWVKRDDERVSTLFGQKAMSNQASTMAEIDKRKKWNRPQRRKKPDASEVSSVAFNNTVPLTGAARRHLRNFVEQFLDSSFNPLFLAVRRAIEREAPRVQEVHKRQYFFLISWFLRAECARRRKQASDRHNRPIAEQAEAESFSLVATVMNQETFVLLNRSMQKAQDEKNWQDLNAGMRCFTQILLTVQEMSESPLDEDQEIAENILNRIFYEQSTHDRIIGLLRTYKDQEFGYLDACTELAHVFLRLLERYSKQNVDMQVRSRRRARKKRPLVEPADVDVNHPVYQRELEADDIEAAQKTTTERKFDFAKFAAKFVNQATVDTFLALLRHYQDLSTEQLKRAHRFFYRVAFKMEETTILFRMDIITLFNKLIKGPDGFDLENPTFKEWEELVRQVFRRLVRRLQDRPALTVELLFSKINSTLFYLEYGYERELPKARPRAPAELEVKPGMDAETQLGVAVSLLINQSKSDVLTWIKSVLATAAEERKAWEEANVAILSIEEAQAQEPPAKSSAPTQEGEQPSDETQDVPEAPKEPETQDQPKAPLIFVKSDKDAYRQAMSRDKYVRLLLSLLNFQYLGFMNDDDDSQDAPWIIPSSIKSSELSRHHSLINKFEFDPPVYEEGKSAEDLVRRKTAPRPSRAQQGSDSEGDSDPDVAETLFPAGGPNIHRSSASPTRLLKRRRNRHAPDEFLDESLLEERREARKRLEAERARKVKSELFVHESDDESDEERDRLFFEQEEERRKQVQKGLKVAMMTAQAGKAERPKKRGKGNKRKAASAPSEASDLSDDEAPLQRKRPRNHDSDDELLSLDSDASTAANSPAPQTALESTDNDTSAETETDTPPSSDRPSSGHEERPATSHRATSPAGGDTDMGDAAESGSDKENEGVAPRAYVRPALQRKNVRAGFIIDSDSDD